VKVMKIISFRLRGKMAHFRKFYSNSSSLSYFIPPRTTLAGIIAGLLGKERDSYYDEFSLQQCKIGLAVCSPVKKTMQKLNNLMIKSTSDFNGSAEFHSQTATEFVIPQDIQSGFIDYQIWLHHNQPDVMKAIIDLFFLKDGFPGYRSQGIALSLGTAFNLGWIEDVDLGNEGEEVTKLSNVAIPSIIPMNKIREFNIGEMSKESYFLVKEEVPLEFDSQRRITEKGLGNMLINLACCPVPISTDSYIQLKDGKNIVWME
jgi:CRISPR-associated protein Cas5h